MNLRPVTHELLVHCVNTDFCTNCSYRIGCPVRHSFYNPYLKNDIDFEIFIQTMEIRASKTYGENIAFLGTEHIRNKRTLEMKNNPFFSYL